MRERVRQPAEFVGHLDDAWVLCTEFGCEASAQILEVLASMASPVREGRRTFATQARAEHDVRVAPRGTPPTRVEREGEVRVAGVGGQALGVEDGVAVCKPRADVLPPGVGLQDDPP